MRRARPKAGSRWAGPTCGPSARGGGARGRGPRQEWQGWEEGPRYAMSGAKGGSSVRGAGPRAYTRRLGRGREAGPGPGGGPGGGTSACGGGREAGPQPEGAVPVRRLRNSGLFPLFLHSFPAPRWMSLSASTTSSCPPRGTAPRRPRSPRTGGQDGSVRHLEVPRHIQRKRTSVSESANLRGALELQTIEPWGSRKVGLMAPVSPHPFHRGHIQTLGEDASRRRLRDRG